MFGPVFCLATLETVRNPNWNLCDLCGLLCQFSEVSNSTVEVCSVAS
jgi:hypothetical protein